jgi:CheY-like chemotaxis protein
MSYSILVMDDDPSVRTTLKFVLEDSGYTVALAENGRVGLALYCTLRPDLVITDIIMPDKEGIETIIAIRKRHPTARIIAISGGGRRGDTQFLRLAKSFGASHVLAKPFTPEELLNLVTQCLT